MAAKSEGKSTFPARKDHFFKVLLGDFAQRLMIPPNFMKLISGERSQKAILQGPSCKKWHVDLVSNEEGTFLSKGWRKFVDDHSLHELEFLVFQHDGDMHFTVSVFDTSGCEREDLFAVGLQKRSKLGISSLPAMEINFVDNIVKTEKYEEYESETPQIGRYVPIQAPSRKIVPEKKLENIEARMKAQEVANSFKSDYPFALICMRQRMRLPEKFSKEHLPSKRTDMVLHVKNGKSWMVSFIPKARNMLSKGWSAFVRGNDIEEGDYGIFELVGRTRFQVHIIGADDEFCLK